MPALVCVSLIVVGRCVVHSRDSVRWQLRLQLLQFVMTNQEGLLIMDAKVH